MAYDFEKYRAKREKVLGVRKSRPSFGALASMTALIIIMGLSLVVVPRSVAFFRDRHLHDAIYRLLETTSVEAGVMQRLQAMQGIRAVLSDHSSGRLIITFNQTSTDTDRLNGFFEQENIGVLLLNTVNHRQRMTLMKKEAMF